MEYDPHSQSVMGLEATIDRKAPYLERMKHLIDAIAKPCSEIFTLTVRISQEVHKSLTSALKNTQSVFSPTVIGSFEHAVELGHQQSRLKDWIVMVQPMVERSSLDHSFRGQTPEDDSMITQLTGILLQMALRLESFAFASADYCMEVADELDKIRSISGRMLSQQIKDTAPHPTFSQEKINGVQPTKHQFLCSVIEQIGDLNDCLWSFKSAISLRDSLVNDAFIQNPQLQIRDEFLVEASGDQDPPMYLEAVDESHLDDSSKAVETAMADIPRANGSSAVHVQVKTSSPALENNPSYRNSTENDTSQSKFGLEDANRPLRPGQAKNHEYEERVNDNLTYLRPPPPYSFKKEKVKMVIVGDGATGKTGANMVAMGHAFRDCYMPTVFENYVLDIGNVELAIFDTAGQGAYERIRPFSYPDTHVAVLAFSIDHPDSLSAVESKWLPEVAHFLPGVPFIVAGLKLDTRYAQGSFPKTTYSEGLSMAKSLNAAAYVECTALTNTGIRDLYNTVANIGVEYKHDKGLDQTSSRSRHCTLM